MVRCTRCTRSSRGSGSGPWAPDERCDAHAVRLTAVLAGWLPLGVRRRILLARSRSSRSSLRSLVPRRSMVMVVVVVVMVVPLLVASMLVAPPGAGALRAAVWPQVLHRHSAFQDPLCTLATQDAMEV